jgi:copper chaperone CopZ
VRAGLSDRSALSDSSDKALRSRRDALLFRTMRTVLALLAVAMMVACASCRMSDVRTFTFKAPQVTGESCRKVVDEVLRKTDGVDAEKTVYGVGTITVTYDSLKLARKNIEHAIAAAGFDVGETPANPAAREALPAECR